MKLAVKEVVICEGRYDKIKLESLIDADIIALDGFGIFKNAEKKAIIREAAKKRGIIVLTDSDNAGMVIRNHIKSITGDVGVIHLYTPRISGKESRKAQPSKEGILGVEGIEADELRRLFERFASARPQSVFTRAMLYEDGLMGSDGASFKRELLCEKLGLPRNMGVGALLQALSIVTTKEEYKEIVHRINEGT